MGDTEVAVVGDTVVAVGGQADVLIPEPDDGPTDLGEVLSALIAEQSAGRQARICCFDCFVFFFFDELDSKNKPDTRESGEALSASKVEVPSE